MEYPNFNEVSRTTRAVHDTTCTARSYDRQRVIRPHPIVCVFGYIWAPYELIGGSGTLVVHAVTQADRRLARFLRGIPILLDSLEGFRFDAVGGVRA